MTFYHLREKILKKVLNITDLGILLDHNFTFSEHISIMVNKVNGVLGFIKRWSREFTDPYITKQLYTSLVRPIFEYRSIVWDPHFLIYVNLIGSVQKRFLLFCLRGLGWNLPQQCRKTLRQAIL